MLSKHLDFIIYTNEANKAKKLAELEHILSDSFNGSTEEAAAMLRRLEVDGAERERRGASAAEQHNATEQPVFTGFADAENGQQQAHNVQQECEAQQQETLQLNGR